MIQTALRSGKINAYPEYIGEIVQTAYHQTKLPKTATGKIQKYVLRKGAAAVVRQ